MIRSLLEARARRREIAALPSIMHGLARELRAGRSLRQSLPLVARAAPDHAGIDQLIARLDAGVGVVEAVQRWSDRLDHRDAGVLQAVLATGATTGAAMAASLDRAADGLLDRIELRREIRALTAQARMSALVLSVSPVIFLAMMVAIDPGILTPLFTTSVGRVCVVVGVTLDALGWWWMHRLIEGAAR